MKLLVYSLLVLFLVISLFPTFLMFSTAFVPEGDLFNRTIEKIVSDFEAPRTVLLTRVRPIGKAFELVREEQNNFARLDPSREVKGLAFSMGSSDINRISHLIFKVRASSALKLSLCFKDIKENVEEFARLLMEPSSQWKTLRVNIDVKKLKLDVLHVSQLRMTIEGDGTLDIDDVTLVNRYPTFYNFVKVLREDYFGRYLLNSTVVSVCSVLGNLFFCSLVAYAFARKHFRMKELFFSIVLATMMIPPQVTIIPTFILMRKLNLINTYWALILPNLVTPFGIFLMRQYFEQLPLELDQAAKIDGAGDFRIFWNVLLPLSKPALSVLGINTFVLTWNDVFYPLILTTSREMRTVQIGLALYQKLNVFTWPTLMAASTIAGLPIIVVFLIFEKRIISGILEGAIKS
ncbi:MAG: Binding-protein-dependent transport systems inner membrane component [Thermotoga sp. 50_1627]|uniref:carbohydrate ABC transporter permease n=1 Tax=Pseudothermotoga sp. TaxID=2033661 RepID=UPI00076CB95C|nr:MAG: Binding-protein-dependent transport systems inner membrane component [Thermotoga sp. 50_64]KUK24425.1 MAG: Binding-protein-dependent transport systems inner membrane component [Thermotoga sp. 50_1627]MBC7117223.1 carbohydrate ABC transporter permease [Pseudothermotoga sp.]MDK2924058.1 multiple sugar transport system permease protein [Pseudothermotoga sp.]HBT39525.1 ABC transporter permease [Pseudothermotoga sp.]